MKYYVDVNDNGTFWYKDPEMKVLHREDGPAVEFASGSKFWYLHGNQHREGGPAVEFASGDTVWFLHGTVHREDGPAFEYATGIKGWRVNGKRHREDGPADIYENGEKHWFLNDIEYTKEEFNRLMSRAVELTIADIEKLVGKRVKIIK